MSVSSTGTTPASPDMASTTDIYLTVDQLLEDARLALDAMPGDGTDEVDTMATGTFAPPDDATIRHLRSVIEKGRRTGCILDSFEERRIAQKELDYLAKVLENYGLSFQETTLEAFSAARLHAIAVPADPFEVLPPRVDSDTPATAEALQAYVWRHLDAVGLRSDRALWDHLTAQLAGDPEAWPLLDFTLKRLYENLKREGTGNKLLWPKGLVTDCRALLADTAREVMEGLPKDEQNAARKVLVTLGLEARRHHGRLANRDIDGVIISENQTTRRALTVLEHQGLVRCVHPGIGDRRWRLVHRSLPERWGELQRWVYEEQLQLQRRNKVVFWVSFGIAVITVLTTATLLYSKQQQWRADHLAGQANVRLFELGGKADDDLRDEQNKLLVKVQQAYETYKTSIAYAALFNTVNRVAHSRESMSAQVMNSYLVTFGRKQGEPTVKLSIPAQTDFVPAGIAGQPVATAFSPEFNFVAIVYLADGPSPELQLNVYRWGEPEPVYSDHPCGQDRGLGNVRLSNAGRFFAVECTMANQVIGAVAAPDKTWIDRIFDVVGVEKLAQERFPFFSGEGTGKLHMVTVSVSGDLTVRPLDAQGEGSAEVTFRIPQFATIIPMDTTYDRERKRVAVLDRQGVVAIYGQPSWFARLFSPLDEAPALLYINANDDTMDGKLAWQPINIEFLPGGKCLRVRRMAIDQDIVAGSFLQHFWDEFFVIDADTLLDMARRLSINDKGWQMPCKPNGTAGY